jgi:sulfur carrier protein ThiS
MASVVVVVVCYWFLAEGEKAADALRDVRLTEHSVATVLNQPVV